MTLAYLQRQSLPMGASSLSSAATRPYACLTDLSALHCWCCRLNAFVTKPDGSVASLQAVQAESTCIVFPVTLTHTLSDTAISTDVVIPSTELLPYRTARSEDGHRTACMIIESQLLTCDRPEDRLCKATRYHGDTQVALTFGPRFGLQGLGQPSCTEQSRQLSYATAQ
jgi:hypothetical protein